MPTQIKTIAEVLQDSGMSQADLSRRLVIEGFTAQPSHVSKIIRGESTPAINLGLAIARILRVPAQRITWGKSERAEV